MGVKTCQMFSSFQRLCAIFESFLWNKIINYTRALTHVGPKLFQGTKYPEAQLSWRRSLESRWFLVLQFLQDSTA